MRQRSVLVLAALLVAAVAAVPIAGLAATGDAPAQTDGTNASNANTSVAPGERLAGVMNVQEAELEGEIDERAFGIRVAKAATNASKASVVDDQLSNVKQRLADLEQRKQELRKARENGSLSEGRYRAEVSELAAETGTATRLANQSETVTRGLPTAVLESKGINVTAIQTLQTQAQNLTGPEVADIAREIAGPNVGTPAGERPERPPQSGGPDERPGNQPNGNESTDEQSTGPQTPDGNTRGA